MSTSQQVAQMFAVLTADSKGLDDRLAKLEKQFEDGAKQADKMSTSISRSLNSSAGAVENLENATKRLIQAEGNRADVEYRLGKQSVENYKIGLRERATAYGEWETGWRSNMMRAAEVEVAEQRRVTANLKAELEIRANVIRASMVSQGASKSALRDFNTNQNMKVLTNAGGLYTTEEQLKASERVVQIAREEVAEKSRIDTEFKADHQANLASMAKFEYEQGNISVNAYKKFLSDRMRAYQAHTSQWKAAASELLAIERSENQLRLAEDKQYLSSRLAALKAEREAEVAIQKEADAMMIASRKEGAAAAAKSLDEFFANQEAKTLRSKQNWSNVGKGILDASGAITAISAASGLMFSNFESTTAAISNNTIMTNAQLARMRKEVLEINKETGGDRSQIAQGYMRVQNFNASGAWNPSEVKGILDVATKEGVSAQVGDLSKTAQALASTMHVYNLAGKEAAATMNIIDQSAAHGNASVEEWVDGTQKAVAMAAAYGIKLVDVQASLTALTQQGFTISEADTQIYNLIESIINPTQEALKTIDLLEKKANSMGISLKKDFTQSGLAARGLHGVIADVSKVTGNNAESVAKLITGLRGGQGAYLLMTNAAKGYHDQLEQNKQLEAGTGPNVYLEGYERMASTGTWTFKRFAAAIETEFMPIGQKAMQLFIEWTPTIKSTADTLLILMDGFMKLPDPIKQFTLAVGGLVILERMTGLLTMLKIPAGLAAGLRTVGAILPGLSVSWGGLATSITLASTAETVAAGATVSLGAKLAAMGAVAGPIALVATAIGLLAYEIYNLVKAYGEMKDAEEEAARSKTSLLDKQNELINSGERGRLTVYQTTIADKMQVQRDTFTSIEEQIRKGREEEKKKVHTMGEGAYGNVGDTAGVDYNALAAQAVAARAEYQRLNAELKGVQSTLVQINKEAKGANIKDDTKVGKTAEYVKASGERLAREFGFKTVLGTGNRAKESDHDKTSGHALDFMTGKDTKKGDDLVKYLVNHAVEEGIKYVIWQQKIWKPGQTSWNMMKDAGNPTANHYDHVHASYYTEAQRLNAKKTTPLTREQLEELARKRKAEEDAQKAAENAQKTAEKMYNTEITNLGKVITLKQKSQSLDTNLEYARALYDLSPEGRLKLIKDPAKREALLDKARRADATEHGVYINTSLNKLDNKYRLSSMPIAERGAAEGLGGLTQWDALGKMPFGSILQQGAIDKVKIIESNEAMRQQKKVLDELAFSQKIAGDAVKEAAVKAAGGVEKWNVYTDSAKKVVLETQRILMVTDAFSDLRSKYKGKFDDTKSPIKTIAEEADRDIKELRQRLGELRPYTDEWDRINKQINQTREDAAKADRNSADNWMGEQGRILSAEDAKSSSSQKNAYGVYNIGQAAVDAWTLENTANGTIAYYEKVYGSDAQAKIEAHTKKVRENAIVQSNAAQTQNLDKSVLDVQDKTLQSASQIVGMYDTAQVAVMRWRESNREAIEQLKANMKEGADSIVKQYENTISMEARKSSVQQVYAKAADTLLQDMQEINKLNTGNPFELWLQSYMELKKQISADGKISYTLGLPDGTDVGLMKKVYDEVDRMKRRIEVQSYINRGIAGFGESVVSGTIGAFNTGSGKAQLQGDLISQKDRLSQLMIEQDTWQEKYKNDPNDPYIDRIKRLQEEIDKTERKISKMGNSLGSTFGRVFDNISSSFSQTLQKMAAEYLQSSLIKYMQQQMGGIGTGGNGGGTLGMIMKGIGLVSSVVSIAGGASANSSNNVGGETIPYAMAEGGRIRPNKPTLVGDGGEPEWIIPDVSGWIVPASKVSRGQNNGDSQVIEHTTVNQKFVINTPDVSGHRSSARSVQERYKSAVNGRKKKY